MKTREDRPACLLKKKKKKAVGSQLLLTEVTLVSMLSISDAWYPCAASAPPSPSHFPLAQLSASITPFSVAGVFLFPFSFLPSSNFKLCFAVFISVVVQIVCTWLGNYYTTLHYTLFKLIAPSTKLGIKSEGGWLIVAALLCKMLTDVFAWLFLGGYPRPWGRQNNAPSSKTTHLWWWCKSQRLQNHNNQSEKHFLSGLLLLWPAIDYLDGVLSKWNGMCVLLTCVMCTDLLTFSRHTMLHVWLVGVSPGGGCRLVYSAHSLFAHFLSPTDFNTAVSGEMFDSRHMGKRLISWPTIIFISNASWGTEGKQGKFKRHSCE